MQDQSSILDQGSGTITHVIGYRSGLTRISIQQNSIAIENKVVPLDWLLQPEVGRYCAS